MPTYTGAVTTGADDYDDVQSTNTYLNILSDDTLGVDYEGFALLDTTAPEANIVITAATLWWNNLSYTKSRNASYQGSILMSIDGSSYNDIIYSFTTAPTIGWLAHSLDSQYLDLINLTGKTYIQFNTDNPGSGYNRNWRVRAYEEFPFGSYSAKLVIDYDIVVATSRHQRYFVM